MRQNFLKIIAKVDIIFKFKIVIFFFFVKVSLKMNSAYNRELTENFNTYKIISTKNSLFLHNIN